MTDSSPFQTPSTNIEQTENSVQVTCVSVPMMNGVAWVTDGFKIFFTNPFLWALVLIIYSLIIFGLSTMVSVLTTIVEPVFAAGFLICARESKYNKTFSMEKLFDGFSINGLKLSLLGLLELLVATAFLITVIVLSFMVVANNIKDIDSWDIENFEYIISAIINSPELLNISLTIAFISITAILFFLLFSMALWFSPALIVFNDVSFFGSLKLSFIAPIKNVLPFLVFSVLYLVIYLIAAIPILLFTIYIYNNFDDLTTTTIVSLSSVIFLISMIEIFILAPAFSASTFAIYEDVYEVKK